VDRVGEDYSIVRVYDEYSAGLQGLEGFSHLIILYWFHLRDNEADRSTIKVVPRRHPGAPEVGVFASRSPSRPNPIGLCVVKLLKLKGSTLAVKGLDALLGSPIIDIKPYNPKTDAYPDARIPEWLNGKL